MPAAVESMFSAREVPWHGLGTITDDVLTAKEALVAAGLDWEVKPQPLYVRIGDKRIKIDEKVANVRMSDQRVLGIVSPRYQQVQNADGFAFGDYLVDDGSAKYETAGSLHGGRVIFITMKVPTQILVGGEDAHDMYLVIRNSHDGSKPLWCGVTPVRVVCQNTLSMALGAAKQSWTMRHNVGIAGKIAEAREALKLSFDYIDTFVATGEQLMKTTVTDADLKSILESVMPVKPKTDEVIETITALYNDSPTNGYKGTAWGVMNALTEYYDHERDTRSLEARFTSIMDGQGFDFRTDTAKLLLAK